METGGTTQLIASKGWVHIQSRCGLRDRYNYHQRGCMSEEAGCDSGRAEEVYKEKQ